MKSFAHIINYVSEKENPSLQDIQKLTLASFEKAKNYSGNKVSVEHLLCHHRNFPLSDKPGFRILPPLEKSILDAGNLNNSKALPFLKDILKLACDNSIAEYIIYSNSDIGLMPQFYSAVSDYLDQGHDALVINRRRIKSTLNKVEQLDQIYSEKGKEHIGYDMFVFKRDLFPKFLLHDTCIGIPFVGNDLFYNLFVFAEKPALLADKHLTFHIGLEMIKEWGSKEIKQHNYNEFIKTVKALSPQIDITKFPGADYGFFKRHFMWLMNSTLSYPAMFKADMKALGKSRTKKVYDPNYKKESYYEWLIKYINFD